MSCKFLKMCLLREEVKQFQIYLVVYLQGHAGQANVNINADFMIPSPEWRQRFRNKNLFCVFCNDIYHR